MNIADYRLSILIMNIDDYIIMILNPQYTYAPIPRDLVHQKKMFVIVNILMQLKIFIYVY